MDQETTLSTIRFNKLLLSHNAAIEAIKKDCSLLKFEKALPMLARDNPQILESLRSKLLQDWSERTKAGFMDTLKQRDMKSLLSEIDHLSKLEHPADGSEGEIDPTLIVAANRYATKSQELDRLQSLLEQDQLSTLEYMQQIQSEMDDLNNQVEYGKTLLNNVIPQE